MARVTSTSSGGGTSGNTAPKISGSPPTSAAVGASYSFKPTASDANGDKLTFSDIVATLVDNGLASARGTWHLDFPDGKSSGGRFVLVLRQFGGKWLIVYDHTTSH